MSETNFFWQGGRKIEVQKDNAAITIQAASPTDARMAAERAGVELGTAESVAPGLVRATVPETAREQTVDAMRARDNVVHHVYRDKQSGDSEYLITESFFIKFKPETPENRILEYLSAKHLLVEREMGDKTYLVRVTDETGSNPIRTANAAADEADVEYAEPNIIRPLTKFAFIPPDDLFPRQWHLHAPENASPDLVAGAGIFAPDAWELTRGRRDIVVAVADDGFDLTHPDFQGEGKVLARLNANLSRDINNPDIEWDAAVSPRSGDYHGTPCLGVAVAEGNGTGVVGAAPGCSLVAVRFPLKEMSEANFIVMFEKISGLADVVSCSWGVGPGDRPMSTPLRESMARLARSGGRRGKGLVFCIAAGNNNCPVQDLENTSIYRYRDDRGRIHSYNGPIDRWIAAHPDVITVSASTSRKTRAAYSSWGRQICVCAPSNNWDDLGNTTPSGRGITTTDNEGFSESGYTPGLRFTDRFGGTSSATPTVAGVCALVLSANDTLTAMEVRQILQQTADKDLSLTTDTPVNQPGGFNNEGFSLWFGHGKVNAFRAVTAAAAGVEAERRINIVQDAGLDIPDAGAPVVSEIEVNDDGTIHELRVQVNISHTYIGDLRVDLITPDNTGIVLHNYTGGAADNLVRTYSVQDTPALRPLQGRSIRGTWQLRVKDNVGFDVGRLEDWRLVARVA
jgi:subtilisin family serine protease/subtilisin-like proprotein convertase family protein